MELSELKDLLRNDVVEASRGLLGAVLVKGSMRARIVETEAYRADDPACHAFRGKTSRNEIMFGEPGFAYVYFSYGCHWMLNVVAHGEGDASAILIRAAEPVAGLEEMRLNRPRARRDEDLLSGPGKLCAAFAIGREAYGLDLFAPADIEALHLEASPNPVAEVVAGERIGISEGRHLPWRFIDGAALKWASKPWPTQFRS